MGQEARPEIFYPDKTSVGNIIAQAAALYRLGNYRSVFSCITKPMPSIAGQEKLPMWSSGRR